MKYIKKFFLLSIIFLILFLLSEKKIFFQFSLLDIFAFLFAFFLLLYSIINLFFFKKNNLQISIFLIFILFFFQALRLNNFSFDNLTKEQQCVNRNIEYEQNKDNQNLEDDYINACKNFRE
jgi:uncharacterized membrane protein YfhO